MMSTDAGVTMSASPRMTTAALVLRDAPLHGGKSPVRRRCWRPSSETCRARRPSSSIPAHPTVLAPTLERGATEALARAFADDYEGFRALTDAETEARKALVPVGTGLPEGAQCEIGELDVIWRRFGALIRGMTWFDMGRDDVSDDPETSMNIVS